MVRVTCSIYPKKSTPDGVDFFGASDVTRTRDLLITSEMHYRLCYTSMDLPDYYIGFPGKSQLLFLIIRLRKLQKGAIIFLIMQKR